MLERKRERLRGSLTTARVALSLSRGQSLVLLVIGLVGLALRIAWMSLIPNTPISDFASDNDFARQFASGVFPQGVTFQGAGYPLALGLAYRLAGVSDIMVGKVENVLFSMVTLALCSYIFLRLSARPALAILATAIVALLPTYIAYTSVLGTEVIFTCCLAGVVALQLARFDWRLRFTLMGLLIGYGAITKPYLLAYPVVAAVIFWLTEKDARQAARLLVVSAVCMLAVIAPITWENYIQLHRFILNTYNASFNLFVNSNSDNTTGAWMPLRDIHISAQFRQQLAERGVTYPNVPFNQAYAPLDPLFMAQAQRWILTHPAQFAHLGVLRLRNTYFNGAWDVRLYAADQITSQRMAHAFALRLFFWLASVMLTLLSVAGFVAVALGCAQAVAALFQRARRLPRALAFPAIIGAFYIAVFFVSEGQPRYSFPILFMFAFALTYLLGEGWRLIAPARFALAKALVAHRTPLAPLAPPAPPRRALSALDQETVKRPRVRVNRRADRGPSGRD